MTPSLGSGNGSDLNKKHQTTNALISESVCSSCTLKRVQEFANKVAVVTGAASGIGKAMAQRFAAEGMRLVLADIEDAPLLHFAGQLRASGVRVISQRVDVSQPGDLETLAARAYDEFGAVHLLCNNAGVLPPGAPVWKEPLQTWQWALGVNFFGVLHGVQAFVPRMLSAKHEAHVVNTASLAGLTTRPLMSAYNVSKRAVVALSECLYAELQLTTDKIHVPSSARHSQKPVWLRVRETSLDASEQMLPRLSVFTTRSSRPSKWARRRKKSSTQRSRQSAKTSFGISHIRNSMAAYANASSQYFRAATRLSTISAPPLFRLLNDNDGRPTCCPPSRSAS